MPSCILNRFCFQPTTEKAQLHALHGDQLIQSNHYAVDSIRPKCVELRRVCDDFSNEAKKKTDILSKSLQIHVGIDKVRIRYKTSHPETCSVPCTWIICHCRCWLTKQSKDFESVLLKAAEFCLFLLNQIFQTVPLAFLVLRFLFHSVASQSLKCSWLTTETEHTLLLIISILTSN